MSTAGALFKLTRFPLVFTAAADSAVGAALVGGSLPWIPVAVCSSFLYAAGMAMNDVVDADRDRTLHPERPIPSGRVSPQAARLFTLVLFVLAMSAARVADTNTMIGATVLVALIVSYNRYLKRWAIPGSLGMAAMRGGNLALGAVSAGVLPGSEQFPWVPVTILACYVFILTLWSTREEMRDGGRGLPALLGIGLVAIPLAGAVPPLPARWAAAAASLWILPWVLRSILRPEPARLMQTVRWGVLGILPLDASFLAVEARWLEAGAVAGLLVPALLLLPLFRRL